MREVSVFLHTFRPYGAQKASAGFHLTLTVKISFRKVTLPKMSFQTGSKIQVQ